MLRRCRPSLGLLQRQIQSGVHQPLLEVAIVGRPNTGKSTLFNRLVGSKLSPHAIVSPVSGTTRDRRTGIGRLAGLQFRVVDTGGLDDRGVVNQQIRHQVMSAIASADVILFVLDALVGVTSLDQYFAQWIRKSIGTFTASAVSNHPKKLILLANKTEGAHLSDRVLDTVSESLAFGMGEPLLISASHGDGMAELARHLLEIAQERKLDTLLDAEERFESAPKTIEEKTIQLAIMGKPNVGKSTLLNAIVGNERVITGPTPGLTRDAIHVDWTFKGRTFKLVDTAGLTRITPVTKINSSESSQLLQEDKRNMQRIQNNSEPKLHETKLSKQIDLPGISETDPVDDPSQYSYQISELALTDALNSLRFAQVVLLVIEGKHGKFNKIDLQIAQKCLVEGRSLVVCANKRDIVMSAGVTAKLYEEGVVLHCRQYLKEFGEVRVVSCSATEADGIDGVLQAVLETHDSWSRRISTWVLNRWIKDALVSTNPPRAAGKEVTIKYMTQVKTRPPTFAVFCNMEELPGFFERHLRYFTQFIFFRALTFLKDRSCRAISNCRAFPCDLSLRKRRVIR